MDFYTFLLGLAALLLALVVGVASTRAAVAYFTAKAAESRRMAALARMRPARSRRAAPDDDEDEEDEGEDEGDEVDDLFDTLDSNPVLAGMAQGYAAQNGLDLEAVRRREPAALAKAQALMAKVQQGPAAGAPAGAFM